MWLGWLAKAGDISNFESCYKERASTIPTKPERAFLDSYLTYLRSGTPSNGDVVILKMKELAKSQGGQFSTKWVSVFEGAMELCCGGPQTCTEGFGSITLKTLHPRVEKGWMTAIFVVLMYERLAKTDGADAEGLKEYLSVIKNKHPWSITMFKEKFSKQ